LTQDGLMHVTVDPAKGNAYLFVTSRYKGSNLRGFLYWPQLPAGFAASPMEVEMVGPVLPGNPVSRIQIVISKLDTPGWYQASRTLD
jgi:hypothetical protein